MTTIPERKATLLARLTDLQGRLENIEDELDSHHDPDWDDLAAEREGDEVLEGIGISGQQEIRMIRAALTRIEKGEYGVCVSCGAAIGEERLDVVPATPFCRVCAAKKGG